MTLFCDACGDITKAVRPCKFVYHDGTTINFDICLDCMENGTLQINLPRKRLVSFVLKSLQSKRKWQKRGGNKP